MNVWATSLEQTKQVFDERWEGHGKELQEHQDDEKKQRLSAAFESIAKTHKKKIWNIEEESFSCRISFAENVFNKF